MNSTNRVATNWIDKHARITEQKAFLSGVMPESITTRGAYAYITVTGNTFPLKGDLSRAGLRWRPSDQSWALAVNSQSDGYRKYDQIAPVIAKAFRTLGPIIEKFNREVDERNKAITPVGPQTMREIAQRIDSISRRKDFLAGAGLQVTHTNKGPSAPEDILYMTGNTLPLRDAFRKFGWKWWPEKRAWWLPLSEWRVVERPFMAAIAPLVPATPSATTPAAPATGGSLPWSNGSVWLENIYHEDEAEDTGIRFTAAGPNSVDVEVTFMFDDYGQGPRRMPNAKGVEIYVKAIKGGRYVKKSR
jgi:hypothetical protein